MSKKFVAYCEGLNGAIGNLFIDETYQEEEVVLPIDALVSSLIKEDSFDVFDYWTWGDEVKFWNSIGKLCEVLNNSFSFNFGRQKKYNIWN